MNIVILATTAARRIGLLVIALPAALGTANGGVVGFTKIADDGSVVYRQRTSSTNTEGDLIVSDGSDSLTLETAKFHDLGSVTAAGDVVFERAAGANSSAGQSIVVRSLDGSESRGSRPITSPGDARLRFGGRTSMTPAPLSLVRVKTRATGRY